MDKQEFNLTIDKLVKQILSLGIENANLKISQEEFFKLKEENEKLKQELERLYEIIGRDEELQLYKSI